MVRSISFANFLGHFEALISFDERQISGRRKLIRLEDWVAKESLPTTLGNLL